MAFILIVEDDLAQNNVLASFLKKEGHYVVSAYELKEARQCIEEGIDLVILDLNLPDGQGFEFLKDFRRTSTAPVIVLTAMNEEETQLHAFELQADEYVEKPFSPLVMTKRVQALLNRVTPPVKIAIIGGFKFDFESHRVTDMSGDSIVMTIKELQILKFLYQKDGKPVHRTQMLEELWGFEYRDEARLLDTHIKNIRKKLSPHIIKTVKNFGYFINLSQKGTYL